MLKLTQSVFNELIMSFDSLSLNAKPEEILKVLKIWMLKYHEVLSSPPFCDYHLMQKIQMHEEEYPIKYSVIKGDEFIHIKNALNRFSFKDKESIARILSEILDRLYFFEVDEECPNCDTRGLLIWKIIDKDQIVFECRQCGFMGTLEGNPVINVVPATNIDLKKAKFI